MAQQNKKKTDHTLPFGKTNLKILMAGLVVIVLGYIAMSQPPVDGFWTMTAAPILLIIAFLLIVPYAILYGHKFGNKKSEE